jgi:aldehyde dehydrogenase (NAD+)
VWVNATNLFDAAAGFGGYKESASAARAARGDGARSRRPARRRGWARTSATPRAQVLYYLAENLDARATSSPTGSRRHRRRRAAAARREVDVSVARLFTYAAWADKYDGAVHNPPVRGVTSPCTNRSA